MTLESTACVIVPVAVSDTGSFTRSTTATYFDADGVLQTAAINVPRIGYDPVTHAHTGLILEGAATNLLTYSEQFDNAVHGNWHGSITPNVATAPDGMATADEFVENSTTNGHSTNYSIAVTSGVTYAFSAFVKAAERTKAIIALGVNNGAFSGAAVVVDLTLGTVSIGYGTPVSYGVTSCGSGWYRVYVAATAIATVIGVPYVGAYTTAEVYAGNGTSGIYVWGAQLEVGSTATSYIHTTSAAVTRAADVVTGGGLIFCTTPEPASGETLWNAATSYTVGDVVARTTTHHLYENLIAGVNATLPELATTGVTPRWLDLGATDRWSQFDQKIGTVTTSATDLTTVLMPGSAEGLALLDLTGVTAHVSAINVSGGAVIYSNTIDLDNTVVESVYDWMFSDRVQKRNVILTDLPGQYPNIVVTVTISSTSGSSVGVTAMGRVFALGVTEYGAGAGIINFGKVTDDGFGNRTWIEGDWANRVTLPMVGNTSDFNRIHRQLATVRSTPCIYIGSALDSMEPLVCYGVFRDLYITVPNYPTIAMNLEIDGMSNS